MLGEFPGGDSINIVYYGHNGSGKTTAAAHAAHLGQVAWAGYEPGLRSKPLKDLNVPVDNIRPVKDLSWEGLRELPVKLVEHNVPTFVLDSVTELTNQWYERAHMARLDKALQDARDRGVDPDVNYTSTNVKDWGEVSTKAMPVFRGLFTAPYHTIVVAQVRRDVDNEGTADEHVRYGPATIPSVQTFISMYADIILYVNFRGGYRLGWWDVPHGADYIVKDGFGSLPNPLVNPTFDRVVKYVNGELTADKDPVQATYKGDKNA